MESTSAARQQRLMSGPRTTLRCVTVGNSMVASSAEAQSGRLTMERAESVARGWDEKSGVSKASISLRLPAQARRRRWEIGTVCSVLASTAVVDRRRWPTEKTVVAATMAASVWRSGRLQLALSSREAFWSHSTLLYFWGTKEARLKMD
jgi:hypothetical protein